MTRLEKEMASVRRSAPGFWRGALGVAKQQLRPTAGKSIAGKIYLPPAPLQMPTAMSGESKDEAVASSASAPSFGATGNFPAAVTPSAAGQLLERGCVNDQPQHGVEPTNRERAAADASHTAALH